MSQKLVLAFGTFDVFHKGHEFFLSEAAKRGVLYVAVARDEHVRILKGKDPQRGEEQRLATVSRMPFVQEAVLSDEELGTYRIVRRLQPGVIVLGFDQIGLEVDLKRWMKETGVTIPLVRLPQA